MNKAWQILVLLNLIPCFVTRAADERVLTFDDKADLEDLQIEGSVSIDVTHNRAGDEGGALSVQPGAKAV